METISWSATNFWKNLPGVKCWCTIRLSYCKRSHNFANRGKQSLIIILVTCTCRLQNVCVIQWMRFNNNPWDALNLFRICNYFHGSFSNKCKKLTTILSITAAKRRNITQQIKLWPGLGARQRNIKGRCECTLRTLIKLRVPVHSKQEQCCLRRQQSEYKSGRSALLSNFSL